MRDLFSNFVYRAFNYALSRGRHQIIVRVKRLLAICIC